MNLLRFATAFSCCVLLIAAVGTGPLQADTFVFDDSFADGNLMATGGSDTNWWTSSSSSGIEISPGALGLVTGGSGRGIHTSYATQTLTNIGDTLTATYTFTTPATVGSGSASFRVGLFDTIGRNLDQNISASSGSPNDIYGWSVSNGNTVEVAGLPGYFMDMDVNSGATADLNFREHNVNSATGRLMATTGGGSFSSFSSGPDEGYTFLADTTYTGSFSISLISPTEVMLTGTIGGVSYSIIDSADAVLSYGFFGFHVNSNQFGSSNSQGDPDNGLIFSNISLAFKSGAAVPEPGSAVLLGGMLMLGMIRRRKV